jgi:hypothetical protein
MLRAFVEVDRATMGPERLAAKLTAYERLYRYVPVVRDAGRPSRNQRLRTGGGAIRSSPASCSSCTAPDRLVSRTGSAPCAREPDCWPAFPTTSPCSWRRWPTCSGTAPPHPCGGPLLPSACCSTPGDSPNSSSSRSATRPESSTSGCWASSPSSPRSPRLRRLPLLRVIGFAPSGGRSASRATARQDDAQGRCPRRLAQDRRATAPPPTVTSLVITGLTGADGPRARPTRGGTAPASTRAVPPCPAPLVPRARSMRAQAGSGEMPSRISRETAIREDRPMAQRQCATRWAPALRSAESPRSAGSTTGIGGTVRSGMGRGTNRSPAASARWGSSARPSAARSAWGRAQTRMSVPASRRAARSAARCPWPRGRAMVLRRPDLFGPVTVKRTGAGGSVTGRTRPARASGSGHRTRR